MKHRMLKGLAPRLGTPLLRGVTGTLRLTIVGREEVAREIKESGSVIYTVWHGRFWIPAAMFGHEGSAILVSRSQDGDIIAGIAERLGYTTVRGSSSRGGQEALLGLEACLREPRNVAITPDGPRGPRHEAKVGSITLAQRTGRAVIPVGSAAHPAKELNSWDRFQIPYPFAKGAVVFGEPLLVHPEGDPWQQAGALGERLVEVQKQAEDLVQ